MDFFAAQDRARRKTWQLVALFVTAVIALIVTTNPAIPSWPPTRRPPAR
jgi:hypothetical protein